MIIKVKEAINMRVVGHGKGSSECSWEELKKGKGGGKAIQFYFN